jgi:hypothetical protein
MMKENKFLEEIIAQTSTDQLMELYVPEWDKVIFFKKLNLQERSLIGKQAKGDYFEIAARTLIFAARDEEGKKLFQVSDLKNIMLKLDADVVLEVGGQILQRGVGKAEDLGEQ